MVVFFYLAIPYEVYGMIIAPYLDSFRFRFGQIWCFFVFVCRYAELCSALAAAGRTQRVRSQKLDCLSYLILSFDDKVG